MNEVSRELIHIASSSTNSREIDVTMRSNITRVNYCQNQRDFNVCIMYIDYIISVFRIEYLRRRVRSYREPFNELLMFGFFLTGKCTVEL